MLHLLGAFTFCNDFEFRLDIVSSSLDCKDFSVPRVTSIVSYSSNFYHKICVVGFLFQAELPNRIQTCFFPYREAIGARKKLSGSVGSGVDTETGGSSLSKTRITLSG